MKVRLSIDIEIDASVRECEQLTAELRNELNTTLARFSSNVAGKYMPAFVRFVRTPTVGFQAEEVRKL